MKFKKCVWKANPTEDVEYAPLQAGNKFVTVRTEVKTFREPIYAGSEKGKWKNKPYKRDFLDIKYPHYDLNVDEKLAQDREDYYLVVNQTRKRAYAVLKSRFKEFYSEGAGKHKKVKGDDGLIPDHSRKTNPEEHKRQVGKNKETRKRK